MTFKVKEGANTWGPYYSGEDPYHTVKGGKNIYIYPRENGCLIKIGGHQEKRLYSGQRYDLSSNTTVIGL